MGNNTTKFLDELGLATFCNKLLTKIDNNYSSKENITWINEGKNLSDLNQFVNAGTYEISGERTRDLDNLPISNTGGGHTFSGKLSVYDSSLPNTGNKSNDCCITQVLTLSNRVGGDGNVYIRTALGATKSDLTWNSWSKLQTSTELGAVYPTYLDKLIDNGIYNGATVYVEGAIEYDGAYFIPTGLTNGNFMIYTYYSGNDKYKSPYGWKSEVKEEDKTIFDSPNLDSFIYILYSRATNNISGLYDPNRISLVYFSVSGEVRQPFYDPYEVPETFVMITINNYATAEAFDCQVACTQLKYGIDVLSNITIKKRTGLRNGNNNWEFSEWTELGADTNKNSNKTYYNYSYLDSSHNNFNTCEGGLIEFDYGRSKANFNFNNYDNLTFVNKYNCGTGMVISIDKDKLSKGCSCNFYIDNSSSASTYDLTFNFGESENTNEPSNKCIIYTGNSNINIDSYSIGTDTYVDLSNNRLNCNKIKFNSNYIGTNVMAKFTITNLEIGSANTYLVESIIY